MKKGRSNYNHIVLSMLVCLVALFVLAGCGKKNTDITGKTVNKTFEDGIYSVNVTMEGGTGKASIASPATVEVNNGEASINILWSSKNYDYMIVNDVKYLNEAPAGEQSRFTFPIDGIPCDMKVIGDTTAMSTPHEIEYTIHISMAE